MARSGRKRRIDAKRYAGGKIRKEEAKPIFEYTLAPPEQLSKREAILGSRTARGEISEPFVHIRPLLSDIQVDVAQEFQRLARKAKLRTEGPEAYKSVLGSLQPRGTISGLSEDTDDEKRALKRYSDAMKAMSPLNRHVVEYLTCDRRPMYNAHEGDPVRFFQMRIAQHLSAYRTGLDQLASAWGWDKTIKTKPWFADGA